MSTPLLDTIVIETAEHCDYSVIWLHGLGASGDDFRPIVPELGLPDSLGVRFIFPHAPVRPITINGGAPMRGWYDITSLDFGKREQDVEGTRESAAQIEALIHAETANGIAPGNIILAGFSQGGAVALFTALTSKHAIGGVMALSTYLPIQEITLAELNESATKLPVFMAHGQFDDVINMKFAEASRDVLLAQGFKVQWHDYPMAHSVSAEEIADISAWMKTLLNK